MVVLPAEACCTFLGALISMKEHVTTAQASSEKFTVLEKRLQELELLVVAAGSAGSHPQNHTNKYGGKHLESQHPRK